MPTGISPQEAIDFAAPNRNVYIQISRAQPTPPVTIEYVVYNTQTKENLGAGQVPLHNAIPNCVEVPMRAGVAFTVQDLSDTYAIEVADYN